MSYGTGLYGVGIYGIGAIDPTPPPPPDVSTADTYVILGQSGITLGGTDEYGVQWRLMNGSDLWQPKPSPRDVSGERTVGHGQWDATEFYGGRIQTFEVHAHAPSHAALHDAHDRINAAVTPRYMRVIGYEPNHPSGRWSLMRQDGQIPWTEQTSGTDRGGAVASTSIALRAVDPLIYSDAIHQVSTGAPSSAGGLMWETEWPATWDATVTTGLLRLTNTGKQPVPILWRIDGPISDPVVTQATTGERFRLRMDIAAGEWVTVDGSTRRVLAQGDPQASRRPQRSGDWLMVPPGGAEYAFSGEGTDPDITRITATTRSAWI